MRDISTAQDFGAYENREYYKLTTKETNLKKTNYEEEEKMITLGVIGWTVWGISTIAIAAAIIFT